MKLKELNNNKIIAEMSNLSGDDTGIDNFVINVRKSRASHQSSVRICRGNKMKPSMCFSVPIQGVLRIIGDNDVSSNEFGEISKWIIKNRNILQKFWEDDQYLDSELKDDLDKI